MEKKKKKRSTLYEWNLVLDRKEEKGGEMPKEDIGTVAKNSSNGDLRFPVMTFHSNAFWILSSFPFSSHWFISIWTPMITLASAYLSSSPSNLSSLKNLRLFKPSSTFSPSLSNLKPLNPFLKPPSNQVNFAPYPLFPSFW